MKWKNPCYRLLQGTRVDHLLSQGWRGIAIFGAHMSVAVFHCVPIYGNFHSFSFLHQKLTLLSFTGVSNTIAFCKTLYVSAITL